MRAYLMLNHIVIYCNVKFIIFLVVINILRYVSSVNQIFFIQFNNSSVNMYFIVNLMLL